MSRAATPMLGPGVRTDLHVRRPPRSCNRPVRCHPVPAGFGRRRGGRSEHRSRRLEGHGNGGGRFSRADRATCSSCPLEDMCSCYPSLGAYGGGYVRGDPDRWSIASPGMGGDNMGGNEIGDVRVVLLDRGVLGLPRRLQVRCAWCTRRLCDIHTGSRPYRENGFRASSIGYWVVRTVCRRCGSVHSHAFLPMELRASPMRGRWLCHHQGCDGFLARIDDTDRSLIVHCSCNVDLRIGVDDAIDKAFFGGGYILARDKEGNLIVGTDETGTALPF